MKDETKQEISIILDLLKSNLIQNGVSMATDKKGNLIFFDTATYVESGCKKFDGFKVNINDLVK
nr:MAG TPA: hypothetical protein [Caudoviricetes sp.]